MLFDEPTSALDPELVGDDLGLQVGEIHQWMPVASLGEVNQPQQPARADQHVGPGGGELLEVAARRLVRAVLGPHHREDAELEQVRVAAQVLDDARVAEAVEEIRMQVLQRIDIFTDTRLRKQLSAQLQPIVDRASVQMVETINEVGEYSPRNLQTADERANQVFATRIGVREVASLTRWCIQAGLVDS